MTQSRDHVAAALAGQLRRSALSADSDGAPRATVYSFWSSRFRHSPDALVPLSIMLGLFGLFAVLAPNYLSASNLQQLMRDFADPCIVALAMGVVIFAGGIDLSVGATFAIANFTALYLFRIESWPLGVAALGVLGVGAAIGTVNGLLIAYVRTKPFITTLAMLLVLRAGFDLVTNAYTIELANAWHETDAWYFLGAGSVFGIPSNMIVLVVLAAGLHVFFTCLRPGVHLMAMGADRKAARHAGIDTGRATLTVYILSGIIAALGGLLYAARQNSAGSDTGLGWEVSALTAVVLGGVSLAGGRGSVGRVVMGSAILFLLTSGLLRLNMPGGASSALIGSTLLVAVAGRVQWSKHRARASQVPKRRAAASSRPTDRVHP